ncbi:hypothetical protein HK405_002793, partial [Cladochytrium tenue]
TLTAQCYCKAVHFSVSIPTEKLPLGVHLCHCSICRYTHGTLSTFHAPLPDGIQPSFIAPSSRASLRGYIHGAQAACERLFCTNCGCHVGDVDLAPDPTTGKPEWRVATSIFDDHSENVFQIRTHCFTSSAGPTGGLSAFLPTIGGRPMKIFNPEPNDPNFPIGPLPAPEPETDPSTGRPRLRASCQCGGVSFTLPRSDDPSVTSNPLFSKYKSPLPSEHGKWNACLDICDDCRLMDGAHVVGWTFLPLAVLSPAPPPDLTGYGTLTTFVSSPGVLRGFCGVCGATVFYTCDEREGIADIAVGILRAPEGALAENWMTWRTGRLSWVESGLRYDKEFTEALVEGMEAWGRERYKGHDMSFSIPPS